VKNKLQARKVRVASIIILNKCRIQILKERNVENRKDCREGHWFLPLFFTGSKSINHIKKSYNSCKAAFSIKAISTNKSLKLFIPFFK